MTDDQGRKAGQVMVEIKHLVGEVAILKDQVKMLITAISPVLTNGDPVPEKQKNDKDRLVPLARDIRAVREQITSMAEALTSVNARVEL